MKYYVSEVCRYIEPVSGKIEKFSMNGRDTENEAMIVYLDKMSAARKDPNVAIETIHIMDEKGGPILTDCYEQLIPEPMPEDPEEIPGE